MPTSNSDSDSSSTISSVVDVPASDPIPDYNTMGYDALYEILSWMPAKSAIKYSSSLCRPLLDIHSERNFIEKQCLHSRGRDTAFFLHPSYDSSLVEFHPLSSVSSGILRGSLELLRTQWGIVASSNGILLLARKTGHDFLSARCANVEFSVCNPATGKWAPLPAPDGFKILLRDGFSSLIECCIDTENGGEMPHTDVSSTNNYTAAVLVETEPESYTEFGFWEKCRKQLLIYSDGKWEEDLCDVTIEGRDLRFDVPVAIFSRATKGLVVHYLCDSEVRGCTEPYIVAFDIRKKKLSREIKLPEGAWDHERDCGAKSNDRLWMFKWKETSICLVRWFMGEFKVWLLDEPAGLVGRFESWRRVMNKTEAEMGFDNNGEEEKVESFGVASGKGLLVAKKGRVYLYGMEGENKGRFEMVGEHHFCGGVKFIPYANTLRPVRV